MLDVLQSGRIAGAALDVYDQEPLPKDHPLLRLDNAIISPHMAYVTEENPAAIPPGKPWKTSPAG